jgi:hypothetical protein
LRADVQGNSGYGTPTGQVTFSDNTGFMTSSNLNSQGNTEPAPHGIFNLAAGAHTLRATYGGDLSFQPSAPSAPVTFTIAKASTTTTVQSDSSAVASGANVSFTATVSAAGQGNQPSGNVVFSDGGTVLGTGVLQITGIPPSGTSVQSQTFYGPAVLPNGQHNITAQYAADANYTASTSAPISVKVAPDFTVQFDAASISITSPGLSGTINLTVTGQTGYNETINLSATSCIGLPLGATCSFTPASITGSGTSKLTISTLAPHLVMAERGRSGSQTTVIRGILGLGFVLGGVFVFGAAPRKRRWTAMGLLVLASLLASAGCGGGGSSGGGGSPGTPLGSYTVTVTTASPTFSHQTTFTLMVQ